MHWSVVQVLPNGVVLRDVRVGKSFRADSPDLSSLKVLALIAENHAETEQTKRSNVHGYGAEKICPKRAGNP